eukprot:Polyplicarium_translucidae@DN1713_c0_g1_i2.p2
MANNAGVAPDVLLNLLNGISEGLQEEGSAVPVRPSKPASARWTSIALTERQDLASMMEELEAEGEDMNGFHTTRGETPVRMEERSEMDGPRGPKRRWDRAGRSTRRRSETASLARETHDPRRRPSIRDLLVRYRYRDLPVCAQNAMKTGWFDRLVLAGRRVDSGPVVSAGPSTSGDDAIEAILSPRGSPSQGRSESVCSGDDPTTSQSIDVQTGVPPGVHHTAEWGPAVWYLSRGASTVSHSILTRHPSELTQCVR